VKKNPIAAALVSWGPKLPPMKAIDMEVDGAAPIQPESPFHQHSLGFGPVGERVKLTSDG